MFDVFLAPVQFPVDISVNIQVDPAIYSPCVAFNVPFKDSHACTAIVLRLVSVFGSEYSIIFPVPVAAGSVRVYAVASSSISRVSSVEFQAEVIITGRSPEPVAGVAVISSSRSSIVPS